MLTSSGEQAGPAKSEFMAAEEIKGILGGRERAEQERIIRWASESLGLRSPATSLDAQGGQLPQSTVVPITTGTAENPVAAKKNIKAFVEEKQPRNAVHFASVVAYFHQFEAADKKETIGPRDLQEAERLSGRERSKKPVTTLHNAAKAGYLDLVGKSTFKINAVGENLVAMALPGSAEGGNGTRKPKKKNARRAPKKQLKR